MRSAVRLSILLVLAAAGPAVAQAPRMTAPLVLRMVKPGLFMVHGGGGNSTIRVTSDGLIVVDGKGAAPNSYEDLVRLIGTVSAQPVRYLVNTHHHSDHTGNNTEFADAGVTIVAYEDLPGEMDNNAPRVEAKPTLTYAGRDHVLRLGGKTAVLHHYAVGHTRADTIVHFPDLKVVATGDELVYPFRPLFFVAGGSSLSGWIESLDQVLKLDWDTAVPGHGDEPVTRAAMVEFQGKLKTLLGRAREQVRLGTPKDRFAASLKTDDLWALEPNYWTQAKVDGLWAEAGGR
jgi:glyoxylase-like metal-dependent hydrolase (beta-lactamase superfamily II)